MPEYKLGSKHLLATTGLFIVLLSAITGVIYVLNRQMSQSVSKQANSASGIYQPGDMDKDDCLPQSPHDNDTCQLGAYVKAMSPKAMDFAKALARKYGGNEDVVFTDVLGDEYVFILDEENPVGRDKNNLIVYKPKADGRVLMAGVGMSKVVRADVVNGGILVGNETPASSVYYILKEGVVLDGGVAAAITKTVDVSGAPKSPTTTSTHVTVSFVAFPSTDSIAGIRFVGNMNEACEKSKTCFYSIFSDLGDGGQPTGKVPADGIPEADMISYAMNHGDHSLKIVIGKVVYYADLKTGKLTEK